MEPERTALHGGLTEKQPVLFWDDSTTFNVLNVGNSFMENQLDPKRGGNPHLKFYRGYF